MKIQSVSKILIFGLLAINLACQKMTFENLAPEQSFENPPVEEPPPIEEPPPVDVFERVSQDFTVTSTQIPADVLFVVDNTQRMFNSLRNYIPDRFGSFISGLRGQDYRVAVTTGDITGSRDFQNGNITRILRTPTPASGQPVLPVRYFLDGSLNNEDSLLQTTLMRPEAICIQTGTHLCPHPITGSQNPLRAVQLFLDKNSRGFLRPNSDFHVIVIAGGDEASGSSSAEVQGRAQALKNRMGLRGFKIHTMIRRPGFSCNGAGWNDFSVARTLDAASRLTQGDVLDICDEFDTTSVRALAAKIRPQKVFNKKTHLSCNPADMDKDGKPDVKVIVKSSHQELDYKLVGKDLEILSSVQDLEELEISYFCKK